MKKLLVMVCLFLSVISLHAMAIQEYYKNAEGKSQYNDESDFDFIVNRDGASVTITEYTGTKQEVNIPPRIQNLPVTNIGGLAFYENQLTSVTIPNSVTSIGNGAFYENQLTSVTIPNSVTSIGEGAFAENQLTSVTIPNSVTSIGEMAFYKNQLTSVIIPNSVTFIGKRAFRANQLTGVTIPDSITSIEDSVFYDNKLTGVTIPDSVKSIGKWAFYENQLSGVTIPGSVTFIGDYAFSNCTSLKNVTVDADNPNFTSEDNILYNKDKTAILLVPPGRISGDYTIPNSINSIGVAAFNSCINLTSISIPESVISIGNCAFESCEKLTGITVDENNQYYSSVDGVLYNKEKTVLVQMYGAFNGNYTIHPNVTTINLCAFYECKSLTSVIIPANVSSISRNAFGGCTSLTSVTFQGTITVNNFNYKAFGIESDPDGYIGDLREKYLEGGIGTYTRENGGTTWTKQYHVILKKK